MVHKVARSFILAAAALATANCAGHVATDRAAVDYNRSFADARNSVLLLNILRAWRNEPLQFSSITSVSGGVRGGADLELGLSNALLGGATAFNPKMTLRGRNPNVTIQPLDSSNFVRALTTPISLQAIDTLLAQGWDANLVIGLAFGGATCRSPHGEQNEYNNGQDEARDAQFRAALLRNVSDFDVAERSPEALTTLLLSHSDAASLLAEGVGQGRRVGKITATEQPVRAQQGGSPAGTQNGAAGTENAPTVSIPILPAASYAAKGLNLDSFCTWVHEQDEARRTGAGLPAQANVAAGARAGGATVNNVTSTVSSARGQAEKEPEPSPSNPPGKESVAPPSPAATQLLPRSIQSMIEYVAAIHGRNYQAQRGACFGGGRNNPDEDAESAANQAPVPSPGSAAARLSLFYIPSRCSLSVAPPSAVVTTGFEDRTFFVRRVTHADHVDDPTLDVLRLLTQLIALQTDDAYLAASRPIIAISPQ